MNIFQFVFFSIVSKLNVSDIPTFIPTSAFPWCFSRQKALKWFPFFFSSDDSFDDMPHQLTIWQFERWYLVYIYIYIVCLTLKTSKPRPFRLGHWNAVMYGLFEALPSCDDQRTSVESRVFQCNWRYERNGWYPNFQRLSYASWNLHPCWVQIISLSLTDS